MACERDWELDAVADGRLSASDPSLQRHWEVCAQCRARAASDERLRVALRALPAVASLPDELSLRRLRSRVLRDAAVAGGSGSRPRARTHTARIALLTAIAALVTVAAFAAVSEWRGSSSSAVAPASALNSVSLARPSPPSVEGPTAADSFAVAPSLSVTAGPTAPTTRLHDAPKPAPPLNASESAPTPNTASSDEADEEYGAAVAMYGAGKFGAAAEAFHGLGIRHPDAPTAEDAMFLEALSLSREGMAEQAARVAARHAARFPQSVHRKDAALLVARAARSRGDCEAARRALAPWLATQDESARRELAGCVQ